MLQYVYNQHEAVAYFVAQQIPHMRRGFGACKAIGVLDESGAAIAGVVYHNYSPEAGVIELSAAALPKKNWLTRETMKRMYEYPFLQIGVQMVMQLTPAEDERTLRQLAAGNYMFVKVPRILGREHDGVLCLLTREAWEENKFNKRFKHHIVDAAPIEEAA